MPAIKTLCQRLLIGPEFPTELKLSLHRSRFGFVNEVRKALPSQALHTFIGLAIFVGHFDGLLEAFAIALPDNRVFVLHSRAAPGTMVQESAYEEDVDVPDLTFESRVTPIAFGAARIAMQVRHKLKWEVKACDMGDIYVPAHTGKSRHSKSPGSMVKQFLDDHAKVYDIEELWDKSPRDQQHEVERIHDLCLRAWLTARLASTLGSNIFQSCAPVDTRNLPTIVYRNFHKLLVELEMIKSAKSRQTETEFSYVTSDDAEGKIYTIQNERFANKLRPSEKKEVILVDEKYRKLHGKATAADGRKTKVVLENSSNYRGRFKAIYSLGIDEPDLGASLRTEFLLNLLKAKSSIHDPCFDLLRKFFFHDPDRQVAQSSIASSIVHPPSIMTDFINDSQRAVVEAIVASNEPFVVVQGPPGTGKTATISVAVQNIVAQRSFVYIVAQSNMGVKNVGDRLLRDGVRFKIIVSSDYYDGWHEHVYVGPIKSSLIVTNKLPRKTNEILNIFQSVSCVLCTLGTICGSALENTQILSIIPPVHIIVDEASQIKIIDYMPVFLKCRQLRKLCFFGDPLQITSHDAQDARTLQTVYDLTHLKANEYFLDTQYRMPQPIAQFISSYIYQNRLKSFSDRTDPSCLTFVDVASSTEEEHFTSFMNHAEANFIKTLVERHVGSINYMILASYDAQKKLIQDSLKDAGLRWDNVASADAFQGSESDYIIISLTRSQFPGFMRENERGNVILTRCKKGTIIVTSRAFMATPCMRVTVVGQICQHWETSYGHDRTWIDGQEILKGRQTIPGLDSNAMSSPYSISTARHEQVPTMTFLQPQTNTSLDFLHPRRTQVLKSLVTETPVTASASVGPLAAFRALKAERSALRSALSQMERRSEEVAESAENADNAEGQRFGLEASRFNPNPNPNPIRSELPEPPALIPSYSITPDVPRANRHSLKSAVERWRKEITAPSPSSTASARHASYPSSIHTDTYTEIDTTNDSASVGLSTSTNMRRRLSAKLDEIEAEIDSEIDTTTITDVSEFLFRKRRQREKREKSDMDQPAAYNVKLKKKANWTNLVPDP